MKTYTTIEIDPISQTIQYSENDGSLEAILSSLSFAGHDCTEMESYQFNGNDRICVDATAGLDQRLPTFSSSNRYGHDVKFYGRAIIVGATASGNPTNVKVVVAQFMHRITWGDRGVAFMWKLSDGNNVGGAA